MRSLMRERTPAVKIQVEDGLYISDRRPTISVISWMRYEQGFCRTNKSRKLHRHILAMSKYCKPALLLLAISASVALVVRAREQLNDPELLDPDETWHQNHCAVRHDFGTDARYYNHMLWRVNWCAATWSEALTHDHLTLCEQPDDPNGAPCGYVVMPLKGRGDDNCTLALRADNLDTAAFANGWKEWFVFPKYKHLFPTATVLDFDNDYEALMGGSALATTFMLGRPASLDAISQICRYRKGPPGSELKYIKVALSNMALTIPEAKRLTPIRRSIVNGWDEGTSLNSVEASYLPEWRDMSCAALVSNKTGVWGEDRDSRRLMAAGITEAVTMSRLDVVLRVRDTRKNPCKYT